MQVESIETPPKPHKFSKTKNFQLTEYRFIKNMKNEQNQIAAKTEPVQNK